MTGLHGTAERRASGATVYLVPGLTARERRAVIRRLRQEASRGVGPALPLLQLALALGLDRARTAARIAGAIVRLHPAVTLVPGALVAAMMTLFVIASADGPGMTPGPRGALTGAVTAGPAGSAGGGAAAAGMARTTAADAGAGATDPGGAPASWGRVLRDNAFQESSWRPSVRAAGLGSARR